MKTDSNRPFFFLMYNCLNFILHHLIHAGYIPRARQLRHPLPKLLQPNPRPWVQDPDTPQSLTVSRMHGGAVSILALGGSFLPLPLIITTYPSIRVATDLQKNTQFLRNSSQLHKMATLVRRYTTLHALPSSNARAAPAIQKYIPNTCVHKQQINNSTGAVWRGRNSTSTKTNGARTGGRRPCTCVPTRGWCTTSRTWSSWWCFLRTPRKRFVYA